MASFSYLRGQLARQCASSGCRPVVQAPRCLQRQLTTAASTSSVGRDAAQEATASPPNPDPQPGSRSARFVEEHAPFMVATYARPPPVFARGQGTYLWDIEDRRYLDFTAGIAVNSLGHCDPMVAEIIADQSKTLMHASNLYYNVWTPALSKQLVEKTLAAGCMPTLSSVFICNSGSEANESAIKFARKAGKVIDPSGTKTDLVAFEDGFHGRTMGSLSATLNPKYQKPFAPMVPGFQYGKYNDMSQIDQLVTEKTCGVIVEPIQGEGGVNTASEEWLVALAKRCREVGAVLIYDEIQCGLSRTGTLWAHASLPKEAHPDILTTAKALGNGFPIGATLVTREVAEKIKVGDHGTTFGGNPLACRVASHVLERLADPSLQESVLAKSKIFRQRFETLKKRYPDLIGETRGKGLILGLVMTKDPGPIIQGAREKGVLVISASHNTLRFVPSLLISEAEIHSGMDVIEQVFAEKAHVL